MTGDPAEILATAARVLTMGLNLAEDEARAVAAGLGARDVEEAQLLGLRYVATFTAASAALAARTMITAAQHQRREMELLAFGRLARAVCELTDALQRHRGRGGQLIRVEKVLVQGDAMIGVSPGEGDDGQKVRKPHARAVGHAADLVLRSADTGRNTLPVAKGDRAAEVQNARRTWRRASR
jgi:hypothetical protein